MKKLLLAVMLCAVSAQAQVSYWFQGWQRMGNAADAQSYFMMPGANVTFTYANNRVYINSVGGGGGALQLFGDVTSPLTALPNVTATLNNVGAGGTHTKVTWNTKGLVTLGGVATLTTDFTGQGPANQLLHGGGAGNLSWSAVDLASADVTGNLGVTHLAGGVGAAATTFWRGDASWNQINLGTDVTGTLPGSSVSGVWLTAGNTLGAPGTFGSLDNQPINLKVNNVSAGKLDVNGSVALGTTAVAAGANSVAIGVSASSAGGTAIAIGNLADATGVSGIAIGLRAKENPVGGFATAIGADSWAEGSFSTAIGYFAHATFSGSMVVNDSQAFGITDTSTDQFVAAFTGGYYFWDSLGGIWLSIAGDTHSTANLIADANVYAGVDAVAAANVYAVNNVIASNNVSAYHCVIATNGYCAATNFYNWVPKWIDIPLNYAFGVTGPNAPSLTAVTNLSVIQELAFDNNDELWAQGQFQHNVATTNAAFPSFYFEPHVHFTTIGTLNSTHSNVTWRIEWQLANINGTWYSGTNSATMGITNNYTHYMLELGHITNNVPPIPKLSAIFRCRLTRPASAAQDYSNAHDVLLDGFDLHIPVGNLNAIGSSHDNAP